MIQLNNLLIVDNLDDSLAIILMKIFYELSNKKYFKIKFAQIIFDDVNPYLKLLKYKSDNSNKFYLDLINFFHGLLQVSVCVCVCVSFNKMNSNVLFFLIF